MARACPICGSRRWRRDHVTGSAVCEDGHVYQDFRVENHEVEGPSQHAMLRRKVKSKNRGIRKDRGGVNEAYYLGDDAEYLRLQALQLLLRYQVLALRKLWDLPDVFEMVVRDLWAYKLASSTLPPPPEEDTPQSRANTPLHLQRQGQAPRSNTPTTPLQTEKYQNLPGELGEEGDQGGSNSGTSSKSDDEELSPDAEVDLDLLEEVSHLSELSDKEEEYRPGRRKDPGGKKRKRLRASDTLVVLMLALMVIRRGIMCIDLESIVNNNSIPYLDFAHSTLLPVEMRKHMNRDITLSLSPIRCLAPKLLFEYMRAFARSLQTDFGIRIPDINLPPVSWRVIGGLGGTPVTHSQVLRLLALVDIDISLHETTITTRTRRSRRSSAVRRASSLRRGRSRTNLPDDGEGEEDNGGMSDVDADAEDIRGLEGRASYRRTDKNKDVVMPELAIVASWLVVMKMSYGMDGTMRRTTEPSEPRNGAPDGDAWNDELKRRFLAGHLNPDDQNLRRRDYAALETDELDAYLNLAEGVLLKDREIPVNIDAQTFPLLSQPTIPPRLPPPTSWRHFHTVSPIISTTPPPLVPGTGLPPEPGQLLRSYDPKDTTGTYPEAYDIALRSAAAIIGVSIKDVAETVQMIERRLEKVRKSRRISMRGKYGKGRPKSQSKTREGRKRWDRDGFWEDEEQGEDVNVYESEGQV